MSKPLWIIVVQDVHGADYTGPFNSREAAEAYVKRHLIEVEAKVTVRMLFAPREDRP